MHMHGSRSAFVTVYTSTHMQSNSTAPPTPASCMHSPHLMQIRREWLHLNILLDLSIKNIVAIKIKLTRVESFTFISLIQVLSNGSPPAASTCSRCRHTPEGLVAVGYRYKLSRSSNKKFIGLSSQEAAGYRPIIPNSWEFTRGTRLYSSPQKLVKAEWMGVTWVEFVSTSNKEISPWKAWGAHY